ncbi:DUF934 domain-containing protein [Jannaschia sp. W003]|uniref:DUF934 domain-containing protein n=1 Tax=Jannaschia sp. W003 TaxID=2867012 RepID=UPI0021A427AA|nr:DUF934 domain-containing protein [Jannaschia sp. W003]UWQ20787.1 DUF934 domain-containing protein [Jannaschia sp. W003]
MPIIRDDGFHADDLDARFVPLAELPANGPVAVDVGPADDLDALLDRLACITVVRVAFPSFSDGRGFTIARVLRRAGFEGRLRAAGHVIADQYAMARRSGFDEVEIDDALAARQPEPQWLARADWQAHDYQARLGRRRAG